jgi:hypothetical protein
MTPRLVEARLAEEVVILVAPLDGVEVTFAAASSGDHVRVLLQP